jgi:hypothetical protein
MSKRNRNKFRNRENNRSETNTSVTAVNTTSNTPTSSRSMNATASAEAQHAAEYKIINRDLLRLVVLNGIMLAAVLALYYANRTSGIVERTYNQLF